MASVLVQSRTHHRSAAALERASDSDVFADADRESAAEPAALSAAARSLEPVAVPLGASLVT